MTDREVEELAGGILKSIGMFIFEVCIGIKEVFKKRSRIITISVIILVIYILYSLRFLINQKFIPPEYHNITMHIEILAAIPLIYLYTLGSSKDESKKKFSYAFESVGLYSKYQREIRKADGTKEKIKDYPKYIKEKSEGKCTIYYFTSNGISLDDWKSKQGQLETSMNCNIIKIEFDAQTKRVVKVYTIKAADALKDNYRWKDEYISEKDFEIVIGEGLLDKATINFEDVPHLLVAGETGSGKSVITNSIIWQVIYKGARVFMVDFKGGIELEHFKDFGPVMWDRKKVIDLLKLLIQEHEKRVVLFKSKGMKKLSEYNAKAHEKERLSRCFLIVDEAAEMLDKDGAEEEEAVEIASIEGMIKKLARLARAQGIHIIMATQRPDTKVITGQIRNNLTGRISGKMTDKEPSMMALGSTKAVDLPDIKGRFIYKAGVNMIEFQAYYFKTSDIKKGKYVKGKLLTEDPSADPGSEIISNVLDIEQAEDQGLVSSTTANKKAQRKEELEKASMSGKGDEEELNNDEPKPDEIEIKIVGSEKSDTEFIFKNYISDD